jgi:hypothetical protein
MSMGVEARCPPCHSAAHQWHMKRQPSLCHCCPCCGRHNCNCCCHLRRHCQLCSHHRCHRPSPSPLPSAIAVAVAVNHCCRCLCCVVIKHCCCRCCHPCCWPLLTPPPLAIAVAISVGHHRHRWRRPYPRVVAVVRQELYSTN